MRRCAWMMGLGLALFGGAACAAAPAQADVAGSGTAAVTAPAAGMPLQADDLGAWLDGLVPNALRRGDVAGAAIAVVKDGQVLLQRGYGLADVEAGIAVDPQRTLFRVGSVSKLLTWTAVMQLVEQGRLDLDADINGYLDFKVPRQGQAITLRQIMTHTSGLEERVKRLFIAAPEQPEPLAEYVRQVPAQIYPPGSTPSYSNYATALAGYIVQRVSGQPFEDYIEQHVLRPLGMHHSSFRQPLPAALQAQLSQGYARASAAAQPFEGVAPAPAGALSASAGDMALFMLAHLRTAGGQASALLQADTAARMYARQAVHTPALPAMALGFYEIAGNGQRVIGHAGDTQWFHSQLFLFPDQAVGLFVTVNSSGRDGAGDSLRSDLFRGFSDRYFPATAAPAAVAAAPDAATAAAHAQTMAAHSYWSTRRTQTPSFINLMWLLQTRFVVNGDGTLTSSDLSDSNGQPIRWREIAPYLWQNVDGPQRMTAVADAQGNIRHWALSSSSPFLHYQPAPATRASWVIGLLQCAVAVLLIASLWWPLAAILRRTYRQPLDWPRGQRRLRSAAYAACVLITLSWLAWLILLSHVGADNTRLNFALDTWIVALSAVSLLAAVAGSGVLGWHALWTWTRRRSWRERLGSGVLLLAALMGAYAALIGGLLSFNTRY